MKNLYVGSLPYSTTEQDLTDLFSQAGAVQAVHIIMEDGRSKGFGFVEMVDAAEADKAIEMFHGYELGGRTLIVNEARPREDRPRNDRPRNSFQGRSGFQGGNGGYQGGNGGYQGGSGRRAA